MIEDGGAYEVMREMCDLLKPMYDEGTTPDTGAGLGSADMWIKVGGIEYVITVKEQRPTPRPWGDAAGDAS